MAPVPAVPVLVLAVTALACVLAAHGPGARFMASYVAAVPAEDGAPLRQAPRRRRPGLIGRGATTAWTAAVLLAASLWSVRHGQWALGAAALPLLTLLVCAALVDACCHRLPNALLGPAAGIALGSWTVLAAVRLAQGEGVGRAGTLLLGSALGGIVAFLVLLVLALVPSGFGLGDVKLGGVLGLWLGPLGAVTVVGALVGGLVIAGCVAIALMIVRVVSRRQMLALGPYLVLGGLLSWALALA